MASSYDDREAKRRKLGALGVPKTTGQVGAIALASASPLRSLARCWSNLPTDLLGLLATQSELLDWSEFLTAIRVCRSWFDRLTHKIKGRRFHRHMRIDETRLLLRLLASPLRRHFTDLEVFSPLSRVESLRMCDQLPHLRKLTCTIEVEDEDAPGPPGPPRSYPPRLQELEATLLQLLEPRRYEFISRTPPFGNRQLPINDSLDRALSDIVRVQTLTSLSIHHPRESEEELGPEAWAQQHVEYAWAQLWTREQIGLIRRQLPSLTALSLSQYHSILREELEWLTESRLDAPTPMQLRKLKIHDLDATIGMGEMITRLPSLTELCCTFDKGDPSFLARLPNLITLKVQDGPSSRMRMRSQLRSEQLVAALLQCTALTELEIPESKLQEKQIMVIDNALPKLIKLNKMGQW
jgi:hypothetical protein